MKGVLILLLLVGCGKKVVFNVPSHFSTGNELMVSEVRPYFDNFVSQAKCLNRPLKYETLTIVIAKDTIPYLGLCERREDGRMTVTIDETLWNQLSFANREKTIIHELIHCTRAVGHMPQEEDPGVIMGPVLYSEFEYDFINHYDYRVKEAFGALDNTECNFTYQDLQSPAPIETPETSLMAMRISSANPMNALPGIYSFGPPDEEHRHESH